MNLVTKNPYRTLGVYCGATTREIQRQLTKVKAFSRVGKEASFETDFEFMGEISRGLEDVNEAAHKIEQAKNKVVHSLFWFYNKTHVDNMAFEYLAKNEVLKALEIWNKLVDREGKGITQKNLSAYLNISTLLLEDGFLNSDIEKLQEAISLKGKIISSDTFADFAKEIAGENVVLNPDVIAKEVSFDIIKSLEKSQINLDIKDLFNAFDTFPAQTLNDLQDKHTQIPKQNIEIAIDNCKVKRNDFPDKANKYGRELKAITKKELNLLIEILGKNSLEVKTILNSLSNEIIQCAVDYFNHFQDSEEFDPGEEAIKVARLARDCPPGSVKNRVNENIEAIQEWVDNSEERQKRKNSGPDLIAITNYLKDFQNQSESMSNVERLISNCGKHILNLRATIGSSDDLYTQVSSAVVNNALGMLIEVVNSAQQNPYYRTDPKAFLVMLDSASRIMNNLANFDMNYDLRQRFNTNKSTINNLKTQLSSIVRQFSASSSSSGGGCYIATMVYGDYDHPQVKILRNYRDSVLNQSYLGKLFIQIYYSTSPKLVKILKGHKLVNQFIRKTLDLTIHQIRK